MLLIICIVTVQCRHYRNTVPVLMQFKRLSPKHISGIAVLIYVCISVVCQLHLLDLSVDTIIIMVLFFFLQHGDKGFCMHLGTCDSF